MIYGDKILSQRQRFLLKLSFTHEAISRCNVSQTSNNNLNCRTNGTQKMEVICRGDALQGHVVYCVRTFPGSLNEDFVAAMRFPSVPTPRNKSTIE